MDYLIRLGQIHESFRRAEIEALSTLSGLHGEIISYSEDSPFCIIRLPYSNSPDASATSFISRSIVARAIYELWGTGQTYEELHADVASRSSHLWSQYGFATFKFSLDGFNGKRSALEWREIINSFRYLGFQGNIRMKDPDVEFTVFEEWNQTSPPRQHCDSKSEQHFLSPGLNGLSHYPKRLFFSRKLATSSRQLIEKHDLKKRPYISTTSMDAELALITANLALAGPGKLFYDPFVGTGGFMVSTAEFGAVTLGSDIDGRSFRGKGSGVQAGVGANFKKYGIQDRFGDCIISDLTNSPFRIPKRDEGEGGWLDGIICDPPYGVREGLKVLGTRDGRKREVLLIDGVPAHTLHGYLAPKKPYSFSLMLDDILDFAARTLVQDARLAFWMPTANEEEQQELQIPTHRHLQLVHCCVQPFNKWSRRLLVYRRKRTAEIVGPDEEPGDRDWQERRVATHGLSANELNPFRKKYFQGFAQPDAVDG